jgi:hypothetical protein
MAYCMGLDKLRVDLASNPKATLDEFLDPHLFGGMETSERVDLVKGWHNVLSQVDKLYCYCNTGESTCSVLFFIRFVFVFIHECRAGNAHGGQASGEGGVVQKSLTGHCYAGVDVWLKSKMPDGSPKIRTTLLEGTKWVSPMFAAISAESMKGRKLCRNACLDAPTLQSCNQLGSLLLELTKITSVNPKLDVGSTNLQILQDKGDNFYANVYVSDDKIIFHESIPGVGTSPMALGAPITYLTHR